MFYRIFSCSLQDLYPSFILFDFSFLFLNIWLYCFLAIFLFQNLIWFRSSKGELCCLQQLTNSCLVCRNVENNPFSRSIPAKLLSVPNFSCCGFFCSAFHIYIYIYIYIYVQVKSLVNGLTPLLGSQFICYGGCTSILQWEVP